jgi:3-phosphoshikimate 1-carboxyvinyltransferase
VNVREDWREFVIPPAQTVQPQQDFLLPPDIGSAAFGLAACALHPSHVTFRSLTPIHGHPEASVLTELQGVGVPMRFGEDGMSISIDHDGTPPIAGRLDCRDIPDMVPILSTLASRARGRTVLSHVSHVRLKESDRVVSMMQLRKMGARVEFDGNDMEFEGVSRLHGAELSSYNDHRVLMALAVAGSTVSEGVTELSFPHAYRISYPEFVDHMSALGVPIGVTSRLPDTLTGLA